jgi:hypothetical protein
MVLDNAPNLLAFGISREPKMSLVTSALEKSHKLPTHNQQYFSYLFSLGFRVDQAKLGLNIPISNLPGLARVKILHCK